MPIYEYLCPDGHRFDVVQRFSDEPVTVCEVCGKPVQRVLHAPAVHYKGKGFYSTDYGRGGKSNGDKADSGSSSDSGSKESSSSGSESKSSDSGSKSDSKSSDSKSSDSKSSSSDSGSKSSGDSSSSKKSDSSKPAA
jgi:putative FmdB family regulatory protein